MKTSGTLLSAVAIAAMMVPVHAVEQPATSNAINDIVLSESGEFVGAVVNSQGQPVSNAVVQVVHGRAVVARAKTNAQGRYAVQGLRGGMHVIQAGGNQQACRLWTSATAPPVARRGLVTVANSTIIRGNCCLEECGESCGEGCGEGCCGQGGCGLFSGGLLGGGALIPIAVFGAVTAVTLASVTDDDDVAANGQQPASP